MPHDEVHSKVDVVSSSDPSVQLDSEAKLSRRSLRVCRELSCHRALSPDQAYDPFSHEHLHMQTPGLDADSMRTQRQTQVRDLEYHTSGR